MVDMPMRQPDLLDRDAGLFDRSLDLVDVPAGVDHHGLLRGLVPDDGAVLFEQRHRNDDRAGLRGRLILVLVLVLVLIFLGHGGRLPIFGVSPRKRFAHKAANGCNWIMSWPGLRPGSAAPGFRAATAVW